MDIAKEFESYGEDVVKALTSDPKVAEAVTKYNSALAAKRDELLGSIKEHKTFVESLGGVDKIKSLAQSAAEAEAKAREAAAASNDIEKVRAALTEQINALTERNKKLLDEKKEGRVNAAIRDALGEEGDINLLFPHISSRIKSDINDDGDVSITVLGKDGTKMLGRDAKDATLKDLIEEMKSDPSLAKGFAARGTKGAGTPVNANDMKGVVNPWAKDTFNLTAQTQLYLSNPELAKALASAVGATLA